MNWRNFRLIIRRVGMVLGLGIFFYLIYENIQALFTLPKTINFHWAPIVFSVFTSIIVYFLQMINLKFIYSFIHQKLSISDSMRGFSLALIPKYAPGYIWGYMSRADWFQMISGIPQQYSWVASLIEITVTVTTGLLIVALRLLLKMSHSPCILLSIITVPLMQFYFLQLLAKKRFLPINNNAIPPFSLLLWFMIIINSLVQWLLLGNVLLLIQIAFSTADILKFSDLVLNTYIFSRSWITGFLAVIIPNGLGIRELVLKDLLGLELGIKNDLAIIISGFSRLILFSVEGLWFLWANISHKRIGTKK